MPGTFFQLARGRSGRRPALLARLVLPALLAAPLVALGCSGSPSWPHNEAVRRAALEHLAPVEVEQLVVRRDEGEPRRRYSGPWQVTVWVTPGVREEEYFLTRPASSSYLYLGEIHYEPPLSRARILVRGSVGPGGPEARWLVLQRRGDRWVVIGEEEP